MDFFEQQELSRRRTRWLILWFAVAVVATVASYCVAGGLVYALFTLYATGRAGVPWEVPAAIAAVAGLCIAVVSACRLWQLREGGQAIAELLGARR
ncbi:MAG TPA: hypothetical protein VFB53_10100, partial [Burkholderiales bacterium]|nr:hypothetical protein [Burkholderiales bacterium]